MKKYSFVLLLCIASLTQTIAQDWDKVYGEKNGMHVVMKDKKYGYIDASKKTIVAAIYDDAFDFQKSGFATVQKNGKQGCIDKTGKLVVPLKYDKVFSFKPTGYAIVKNNNLQGCIDKTGKIVISIEYDKIYPFKEGLALLFKDKKYGYANTSGKVIIPLTYDDAFDFKNGKATVVLGNKKGKITPEGKVTWGLSVGDFAHGGVVIKLDETGQHGVVCDIKDCGGHGKKMDYNALDRCMLNLPDKKGYKIWRIPSWDELKLIYKHHQTINKISLANQGQEFGGRYYWSSKRKHGSVFDHYVGWINSGEFSSKTADLDATHSLRAVRDF